MKGSNTIFATAENRVANFSGTVVLLDEARGTYYTLTGIGGRIWELIQNPVRVDELVAKLFGEYDVDLQRCRNEVMALLDDLEKNGLIDVRKEQSAQVSETPE